jgi:Spy/CpxP family protein refolding chaperone
MKTKFVLVIALAMAPLAWAADPAPAAAPTDEQTVEAFRKDLMASRADIMAKGLTLTADQAAKFWPMFESFQKEQEAIVKGQIQAIEQFAQNYPTLGDKDALGYINSLLERDQKMHDLRVKWLAKFQTAVPVKIAARAIQLDRRLGQVTQVQLSQKIPLVR